MLYTINSHKLVIKAFATNIKISFHDWIHYKSSNQEVQTKNSFTAGKEKVVAHKQHTKAYTTHEHEQPKITTDPGPVGSSPNPSTEATTAPLPAPTSTVSAQVSSSKQELVQLVEKSKGSKRFLELQWIHFIDSGGQPQFHEVYPAFIRNATATIFVMEG